MADYPGPVFTATLDIADVVGDGSDGGSAPDVLESPWSVTLSPSSRTIVHGGVSYLLHDVTRHMDAGVALSVQLPADDPAVTILGVQSGITWRVSVQTTGTAEAGWRLPPFDVSGAAAATVNLAPLVPAMVDGYREIAWRPGIQGPPGPKGDPGEDPGLSVAAYRHPRGESEVVGESTYKGTATAFYGLGLRAAMPAVTAFNQVRLYAAGVTGVTITLRVWVTPAADLNIGTAGTPAATVVLSEGALPRSAYATLAPAPVTIDLPGTVTAPAGHHVHVWLTAATDKPLALRRWLTTDTNRLTMGSATSTTASVYYTGTAFSGAAFDLTLATAAGTALQAAQDASTAAAAALAVAQAARGATGEVGAQRLDGSQWLILGDSNSILGTSGVQGQSYTTYLPWLSGRLREASRLAVSGSRSDQQLDAMRAYLLTGARPTMATCMVGTNDINQSIPIATWQANVTAITQELRAAGCETVLFTLPPRSGPANPTAPAILNGQWNEWLRTYAAAEGFLLFDLWKVVADPTTGEHRTGWVDPTDGVHLTAIAHRAVGYEATRVLAPLLKPAPESVATNLLEAGTFTAAGAVPAAWTTAGNGWSVVADPSSATGFVVRLTSDVNPTTRPDLWQREFATEGTYVTGDLLELAVTFRIRSAANVTAGFGMRASITEEGGTTPPSYSVWLFGQSLPTYGPQTARFRWNVGAGRTSLRIFWQYLKPANTTNQIIADLHSAQLRNLTR